jgi:hypothetical protein
MRGEGAEGRQIVRRGARLGRSVSITAEVPDARNLSRCPPVQRALLDAVATCRWTAARLLRGDVAGVEAGPAESDEKRSTSPP